MLLVRSIYTIIKQINYEATAVNGTNSDNAPSRAKRRAHCDLAHESCDATLDAQLLQLIDALRLADALALIVKSFGADQRRYPSSKTATVLISALAREGDVEGVRKVRDVVDTVYPVVSADALRFEHYDAEALSRSGRAAEAILKVRGALRGPRGSPRQNMLPAHVPRRAPSQERHGRGSDASGSHVREASRPRLLPSAVQRVEGVLPEREATLSRRGLRTGRGGSRLRPRAKPFFEKKVSSVISYAVDRCDVDMVQRLLNVVLCMGMPECCGLVLSFLLGVLLVSIQSLIHFTTTRDADDLRSAQKTFEHSETYGIELNPVTFYRYTCFLSSRGIQIPHDMLLKKYKMDPRKAKDAAGQNNVKFKF
ncbi:hypothetical protein MRX96_045842 [Rhipicephalus microplus]